jgi:type II secretory pathway component PulF
VVEGLILAGKNRMRPIAMTTLAAILALMPLALGIGQGAAMQQPLANVMNRVAEFCEEEVRTVVKSITSLIEPAMIIVMGILIGGIAMAMLLPVFSMSKLVH